MYQNFVVHDYEIEPILRHLKPTAPGLDRLPDLVYSACSFIGHLANTAVMPAELHSPWAASFVLVFLFFYFFLF